MTTTTTTRATAQDLNRVLMNLPWHDSSDHAVVVGIAPDSGMPKPVPATRRVPDGIAAWTDSDDGRIWVRERTVPTASDLGGMAGWLAIAATGGAVALPESATVHGVAAIGVIGHEDAHAAWTPYAARTATDLLLEDLRIEGLAMDAALLVARPILRACAVTHVFDPARFAVRTVTEAVTAYLLVAGRVRLGILSDGSDYWLDPSHVEGSAVSTILGALDDALGSEVTARLDEAIDAYIETDSTSLWTSGRAGSYFWTTGQGAGLLRSILARRAEIADEVDALVREVGGDPDRITDPFHGEHGCQFGPAPHGADPGDDPQAPQDGEEPVSLPGSPSDDPDAASDPSGADGDASGDPEPATDADADAPMPVPAPGGDAADEDPEESREIDPSGETTSMIDTTGKADRVFEETTDDSDDAHDDRPIDPDLIEAITDAARDLSDALSDAEGLDTSSERRDAATAKDDIDLMDPHDAAGKVFGRYGANKRQRLLADFGFGTPPSGHDLLGEFAGTGDEDPEDPEDPEE